MNLGTMIIYLTFILGLIFGVIAFVGSLSGHDAATGTSVAVVCFLLSGNIAYLRWLNKPHLPFSR